MAFEERSILLSSHVAGIKAMFAGKPGPDLKPYPGGTNDLFKELSKVQLAKLKVMPELAGETLLGETNAKSLIGYLKEVAGGEIPGWVTTVVGVSVPQAWMGVAFDVLVQVFNGLTADERTTAANLAGRVNDKSKLSAIRFVTADSTPRFVFAYILSANLNGTIYYHGLSATTADIRIL